jgi:MFS family permease
VASPFSAKGGAVGLPRRPYLYYGWLIVATLGITEMTSWGVLYYAFSVIMKPLQDELQWNQGTITGAFSLALLMSGLAAVPIGRRLDRYGARLIMTAGSVAAVLLVIAWSRVTTVWSFYLVWFLIGITTAALFYEPAFTVVANWFDRKRAQALTLLTFGGGLASVVFVPLTEWLVRHYGWRPALLILAVILLVVTVPLHALVLRRRPADLGLLPDGEVSVPVSASAQAAAIARLKESVGRPSVGLPAAVREAAFWWLAAGFSLSTFASISVTVYLIPYLTSRGFSTAFAAATLGLLGGSQIPGRLIFTPLGNRFSRRLLTAFLFAMQAAALVILMAVPNQAGVLLFAVLFGSGAGASSPARAALLAEMYGPLHYGSISGVQALVITVAKSVAPLGMGLLFVATGSYQPVLWTLLTASTASIWAMLMVRNVVP